MDLFGWTSRWFSLEPTERCSFWRRVVVASKAGDLFLALSSCTRLVVGRELRSGGIQI